MTDPKKQMLVDKKRAKWLLGISGIAVAAALLSQMQYADSKNDIMPPLRDEWISHSEYLSLEKDEQTLLTLDWSPFIEEITTVSTVDRETKAS